MPRKPKHPPKGGRPAAERQFVDREEFIAPVHIALKGPERTKPLVLVYHGGAGIGKSRLRRELVKQMAADPGVLVATLDFHIPSYRQPDAALLFLRNSIRKAYQVEFPSFDLAYAVYWQKTHPETPLLSGDELKPLLGPGSLLSRLLDDTGKLALIGLIPKIAKVVRDKEIEGSRDRVKEPPTSNLPPSTSYLGWWEERGERELEDIPQLEPGKIVERLPTLWAADLKDHLSGDTTAKMGTVPQRVPRSCSEGLSPVFAPESVPGDAHVPACRAVLFIDSYETLWETGQTEAGFFKQDEWVRELVKQLPEALWVICGRQKLRWEEVEKDWGNALSQHQLGALPDPAARRFLESCDVTTGQIQDAIVKGSQGVPHYLDLAVDAMQSSKLQVSGSRFGGGSPDELVEQFTRQLERPEVETLKLLSAPRFWYYGLFEHLITRYQTGYPLTAYDDLARFSFVKEGAAPGTRTMHELMRTALQENQPSELRKRVHLLLHEYYAKQLEGLSIKSITDRHRVALAEAFYHGRQVKSADELWTWTKDVAAVFDRAGQYRLVIPIYREVVRALGIRL